MPACTRSTSGCVGYADNTGASRAAAASGPPFSIACAAATSCCAAAWLKPCRRDTAIVLLGTGDPLPAQRTDCASSARSAVDVHVATETVDDDAAVAAADLDAEVFAGTVIASGGFSEIAAQVAREGVGLDLRGAVCGNPQSHVAAHGVHFPDGGRRERCIELDFAR